MRKQSKFFLHIKAFFRVIFESLFDVIKFATLPVWAVINIAWAAIASFAVFLFYAACGLIGGFSLIRAIIFIVLILISLVFNGIILKDTEIYQYISLAQVQLFSINGFDFLISYIPFVAAIFVMIWNSACFVRDQLVSVVIGGFWEDCKDNICNLYHATFFYRWTSKEEPFWNMGQIEARKYNSVAALYGFAPVQVPGELVIAKKSVKAIEPNSTASNDLTVTNNQSLKTDDIIDEKKKNELDAYTEVFGDCFLPEEIAERYKEIMQEVHPETGHSPNKEKYEYTLLAFNGALNWIVWDKDELKEMIK